MQILFFPRVIRSLFIFSVMNFPLFAHADVGQANRVETLKFNGAFIHGANMDVSRFNEGNPTPAGEFEVQVSVNNVRHGKHKVTFNVAEGELNAEPCFSESELTILGIRPLTDHQDEDIEQSGSVRCATIDKWISNAHAHYILGDFHLDLTVPQAFIEQKPRGYTDPNSWDSGVTAALFDYSTNMYAQKRSGSLVNNSSESVSGNLGLLAGLNFHEWRLRKRLNSSWVSGNSMHTQSLFTYIQRDVPVLKSQLTLGDSVTNGDLFDGLTLRGIQLQSDDRMLPDGLRNYTPLVRGIADTNAKIQVTQRGNILYETTVPPGPFELSDISAMGYGGDLLVTVTESDGRQHSQIVPFSAPPMLLHDGVSRFGFAVGKLQDNSLHEEPKLAEISYQYGLGNMYTIFGGAQHSDNYNALGFGNAFNTPLGGISMNAIHSRSELPEDKTSSGNSYGISFSKYLETSKTDITVASWRYSSLGYFSLRDSALARYGAKTEDYLVDYRSRQRFTINLGQPLWNGARVNFSGNFYTYWDERSSASQYMFSYNKSERYFSWSMSASRSYNGDGHHLNNVMLSISVPLGRGSMNEKPAFNSIYSTASHTSDGNDSLQVNAIGSQGEQNELSYGVGSSVDRVKDEDTHSVFSGNVNYNSPVGQLGSTASLGSNLSQTSLSANGSLIVHGGGITAGPRLGDSPFALVEAPGAKGAKMLNGYGSQIDANGYAIVPSLTPYRENTVAVNTIGLPTSVDVLESESTVIPRMGSVVKVNVKTIVGEPVVLIVKDTQELPVPIGTEIYDVLENNLGIIGQGGMAFIRGWKAEESNLYVKNSSGKHVCTIYSDKSIALKIISAQGAVIQVEVLCR
ncbi:fimbria/pilus outer membrane usher protein [Hafnia alvei]|nr:fimbria/pilus outer membrane usher protein [Hafnia alvei]